MRQQGHNHRRIEIELPQGAKLLVIAGQTLQE
jgi:hypothetical protein